MVLVFFFSDKVKCDVCHNCRNLGWMAYLSTNLSIHPSIYKHVRWLPSAFPQVHRAKAILSHLVKCIAGEIVALKDSSTNPEKRMRSRTISLGGSTARDQRLFSKAESSTPDYTEISSVPPLPLYALLAADDDTAPKPGELPAWWPKWNEAIKYRIKLQFLSYRAGYNIYFYFVSGI